MKPIRARSITRRCAVVLSTVTASAALVAVPVLVAAPASAALVPQTVLTVGADDLGQQGNGAAGARVVPGAISGPQAVAVASGRDHAYLLDADGHVWGWGDNSLGAVGDRTNITRTSPVQTPLQNIVEIESGHNSGIALDSSGRVWTWGLNANGQLGLGSTTNQNTPQLVPSLTNITHIVTGRDVSYALKADGTVMGFGANSNGEVGDGTTTQRTSPVPVLGLSGIVELAAGRNHGLALDANGGLWAWGDNAYGQVGDNTTLDVHVPKQIAPSGYLHVDAGAHHSIAVRQDGTVMTWGRGYRGQLGSGSTANRLMPTPVTGLPGIVEVGDGRDQSFALTADGHVYAWGYNDLGQLGDGTTTTRNSPVLLQLSGIGTAQGGRGHTVFLPTPLQDGNQPPTASFTLDCTLLTCTFDGSASSDADGSIVDYSWDFGDGQSGGGALVEHTFAASGTYTVSLTVTDDAAATGSTTRSANVSSGEVTPVGYVGSAVANASARTHRVSVPATVQAGHGMVLVMTVNSLATVGTPAGVTGWVLVRTVSGPDYRTTVWAKQAAATDAGASVSVTLSTTSKAALAVSAYSGTTAAVVTGSAGVRETVSRTGHTTPTVAVGVDGSRLVSIWSDKSSTTTTMSTPAGQTARQLSTGSSTAHITMLVADSLPAVGTAGGLTSVANSATAKATMISLVLAPA